MERMTTNKQVISSTSLPTMEDKQDIWSNNQLKEDALFAASLAEQDDRDCASDAALAMLLQKQFDLEYDSQLKRQEARLNGLSKVCVSLDKFRRTGSATSANFTSSQDEGENNSSYCEEHGSANTSQSEDCRLAWDVFEESEMKQRSRMMGRSGFVLDVDGNMITKHDIPTTSRKNMCRLMELKTDIETGDAGATKDDFKITNYVYNKLKVHSKKSSRRASQRLFDKKEREQQTSLNDALLQSCKMNEATKTIMDGLLVTYKIEKLNCVIGHGKESTVLHATGLDHEDKPGQELAVKIYRTDTNVAFKTRDTYNKSKCPSYKFDKPRSKNDSLNKWAERGFKNLKLMRKANISCPEAISLKKHVLIMTFLGSEANPSPQLKEAKLDDDHLFSSYKQIVEIMKKMYNECDLIHADLSEYNLLWHENQVYVLDVSQSMFSSHPNSNAFLYRDCKNILDFYRRSGLTDIMDEKALFMSVCGKDLSDKDVELWSKIENFPSNEKLMQKDNAQDSELGLRPDDFAQMLATTMTTS